MLQIAPKNTRSTLSITMTFFLSRLTYVRGRGYATLTAFEMLRLRCCSGRLSGCQSSVGAFWHVESPRRRLVSSTSSVRQSETSTLEAEPCDGGAPADQHHPHGTTSSPGQKTKLWKPAVSLEEYLKNSIEKNCQEEGSARFHTRPNSLERTIEETKKKTPKTATQRLSKRRNDRSERPGSGKSRGTGPDNGLKNETKPPKKRASRKAAKGTAVHGIPEKAEFKLLCAEDLKFFPIGESMAEEVPELSHNLDRVLFNPGVYQIQDHRTGVYNFDPYLTSIMPVKEFDFSALKEYITSSKDVKLRRLCSGLKLKYCGSTSSMTSLLSHFHYLLSSWRKLGFYNLSRWMEPESLNFTLLSRGPAAVFLRYKDGVYAIDADKEFDVENVLSQLGKSMEKLLTLPKEEFEKYRRTKSHQISEEERNADESYHYTTIGDFMLRSQLDAYDKRLPGTGMFDLKTRAVISIRMDVQGYEKGVGYEIRTRFGKWESFEREYYDMIRSAFLKYSLQVRMGRMDGIFVAFHNTQRIFGFQYISLSEMDQALHGTADMRLGDVEFKLSLGLLNDLLDRATKRFPERSLRIHVETRPTKVPLTYFFVEPVTEEMIQKTQEARKPEAEQLEHAIRISLENSEAKLSNEAENTIDEQKKEGEPHKPVNDAAAQIDSDDARWSELMVKAQETVEIDSLSIDTVTHIVQEALEQYSDSQGLPDSEREKILYNMFSALTTPLSEQPARLELIESQEAEHEERPELVEVEELENRERLEPVKERKEAEHQARSELAEKQEPKLMEQEQDDAGFQPQEEGKSRTKEQQLEEAAETKKEEESSAQSQGVEFIPSEDRKPMDNAYLADLILKAISGIDDRAHQMRVFQRIYDDLGAQSTKQDTIKEGGQNEVEIMGTTENQIHSEEPRNRGEAAQGNHSEAQSGTEAIVKQTAVDGSAAETACAESAAKSGIDEISCKEHVVEVTPDDGVAQDAPDEESYKDDVGTAPLTDKKEAATDTNSKEGVEKTASSAQNQHPELFGLYVTVRNKVNGKYVERPTLKYENFNEPFNWNLEYAIEEVPQNRVHSLYYDIKKRRKKIFDQDKAARHAEWYKMFKGILHVTSKKGEQFRKEQRQKEAGNPISVVWDKQPQPPGSFDPKDTNEDQ